MAFTPLTAAEIAASEPTKQELFLKIKDDFDDHESRISSSEAALQKFTPLQFKVIGTHYKQPAGPETGLGFIRIAHDLTLTAVRLWVATQGSSGALQIDLQKRLSAGGPFTTIFSLTPNVVFSEGDFTVNSGTLSTTSMAPGDFLRLDVDAYQVGLPEFTVDIEFEIN